MRSETELQAGRLLRLLLIRRFAVPAEAGGCRIGIALHVSGADDQNRSRVPQEQRATTLVSRALVLEHT